jgi:hypothetical protein
MEIQGYPIKHSYFEQDNESTIKLIKNGRASAGRKSKHINIRYFWITDRIKREGFTLRHCNTESMLADFLSKPQQGSLFRKFRDALLGYAHLSSLSDPGADLGPTSPAERVGESVLDERRTAVHESHQHVAKAKKSYAAVAKANMDGAAMHGFKKIVSFGKVKTS